MQAHGGIQYVRRQVELAIGSKLVVDSLVYDYELEIGVLTTIVDLCVLLLGSYGVSLGMDWLEAHQASIDCQQKIVQCIRERGESVEIEGVQ